MKHQTITKQIKEKLLGIKVSSPEYIIFDCTDMTSEKKIIEKNNERIRLLDRKEDFPEELFAKRLVNYIGCDMNWNEVFAGRTKGETRRHKNGCINETEGIRITGLSYRSPTIYRLAKRHPLYAHTYHGEDALIIGLKYDIILPLLDYADNTIEWNYNPESMAYCDGSKNNKKNTKRIVKSLEYILANLNLLHLGEI